MQLQAIVAAGLVSLGIPLAADSAESAAAGEPPAPGTHGHYRVLTGKVGMPPPFAVVDVVYGPREGTGADARVWWQLSARASEKEGEKDEPLFRLRGLTRADPLAARRGPVGFERYILRVPAAGETLEFRDVRGGPPPLPVWTGFEEEYLPRRARGSGEEKGIPETAEYLGHVLTLAWAGSGVPWDAWEGARVLDLDPEMLVGTGRNFRDAELRRLPQEPERRNYRYVPFTEEEYPVMIDAGINLFLVDDRQWEWVRGRPVFAIWGAGKGLRFPADLYRPNWLGPVMFLDEPAIILVGDKNIHDTLRYFPDAVAALGKRIRSEVGSTGGYGRLHLDKLLRGAFNLGDLRVEQANFPSWETLYETAWYQLETGMAGIVHEGRYRLPPFDESLERFTGVPRKHSARDLLRWHYAFLRGAARSTGGSWGTSIYGQCDPAISGEAVTLARDMGARYVWFWTSDHDHHVPWPEQLDLARRLKSHAAAHPRPSLRAPWTCDRAIAIPYGAFVSLEDLWWVRVLDREGKNEASRRYRALVKGVIEAFHGAIDTGEDFDIIVDDGRQLGGYRKVTRIGW